MLGRVCYRIITENPCLILKSNLAEKPKITVLKVLPQLLSTETGNKKLTAH